MQEMIRNKLTSVQRMEVTANRIGDNDILDSVFNQDIDIIRRTMEETSHENFYKAADAISFRAEDLYLGRAQLLGAGDVPFVLHAPAV